MDDDDWRDLLDLMRDGTVVPIVGSRLLVDADGASLYAGVARQLLAQYKGIADTPLPPFRELNEAVMRVKSLLRSQGNQQDFPRVYRQINSAIEALRADAAIIPTPLQELARITDFRLLVTLTPDDLLARALGAVNRAPNKVVHSPKLGITQGTTQGSTQSADLPDDWADAGSPVQLLYLFGRAMATPVYAVHDEDVLEYAHNVISRGSQVPTRFLDALRDRNLLLIGCNFPDWLSRFILRATRKGRLAESRMETREWLVDSLGTEDPFIGFLGQNSPGTEALTNVEPAQFVAELYRRWSEERAPAADGGAAVPAQASPAPASAMFFISYSRTTDQRCALKLKDALTRLGVGEHEIWFDRVTLKVGDVFDRRIADGIRTCRYFLPLVSRAATDRDEAFVFREWEAATKTLPSINTMKRRWLVPLVVDAEHRPESYEQASVREWCERGINFGHAPDGEPDAATLDSLKLLVRDARVPKA